MVLDRVMASSASIPATSAAPVAKASSGLASQRRLPQSSVTLRPSLRRTNLAFSARSPAAQVSGELVSRRRLGGFALAFLLVSPLSPLDSPD